jgi:hypothetical protein
MELNSIAALYGGYVDSLLNNPVQGNSVQGGILTSSSTNSSNGFSASSQSSDSSHLSPLAHIFSTLQQLQETNPARYQQVTQKIAVNLQNAAQTAEYDGNIPAASQLNQLATDFTDASTSGELPNIEDLASIIGGGYQPSPSSLEADNPWNTAAVSTPSFSLNPALNPLAIILNTLSSATGKP